MTIIDATDLGYQMLNERIKNTNGPCTVTNCCGQRFLAAGMADQEITVQGVPGNALGAFLNGAQIFVEGNAQDAVGDTMNDGRIAIAGSVGDAAGYAMRGGRIFIRGDAGYRAGIHMKAYEDKVPVMVIGGCAGSFLGEYQAGGIILVLGVGREDRPLLRYFPCTGMHGGALYLRGSIEGLRFPPQVSARPAAEADLARIHPYLTEFCELFGHELEALLSEPFTVVTPDTSNPFRQLYVAN